MRGVGTKTIAILVVLVAVAGLVLWTLLRPGGDDTAAPGGAAAPSPSPSAAPAPAEPLPSAGGPVPPATGAWLGASVAPDRNTEAGRVLAVNEFEQTVGRQSHLVHVFHRWADPFPSEADLTFVERGSRLLVTWNGMDTVQVTSGASDDVIRAQARSVRDSAVPILLVLRAEMDRPNLQGQMHSPEDYVAAWVHVREIFAAEGADNVSWVWCPTSKGFDEGSAAAWYPGDDQVDWLCVNAYPGSTLRTFEQTMDSFMTWVGPRTQPIMVGEFGISERAGARAEWLQGVSGYVRATPQIKGLSYFEGDSETKDFERAQLALSESAGSVAAFHGLLADSYFNTDNRPIG